MQVSQFFDQSEVLIHVPRQTDNNSMLLILFFIIGIVFDVGNSISIRYRPYQHERHKNATFMQTNE